VKRRGIDVRRQRGHTVGRTPDRLGRHPGRVRRMAAGAGCRVRTTRFGTDGDRSPAFGYNTWTSRSDWDGSAIDRI